MVNNTRPPQSTIVVSASKSPADMLNPLSDVLRRLDLVATSSTPSPRARASAK